MQNNMRFALGFIGRHAPSVLPLGVLLGLFVPLLSNSFQSLLLPALFVSLTLSLVRIETKIFRGSVLHWRWIVVLSVWILILRPLAVWLILQLFTLPESLVKAVVITAAAPPVTACAAIAIFLGIDAAIVVAVTVTTMFLVPISLPPVVFYLVGLQIEAELWQVSLRLALFIFLAFFAAALIKNLMGQTSVQKNAATLDGISVIFIGIFVIGVMHGVTHNFMQQPWYVFQTFLVSSLLVFGLYIMATLLFWRLGPRTALAIGLVSGNCNMGLMYLILMDQVNLELLIFFAIGQIPMYFLPSLMTPLIKRILAR
jgi:BASS family bile acid:Na+ symporter